MSAILIAVIVAWVSTLVVLHALPDASPDSIRRAFHRGLRLAAGLGGLLLAVATLLGMDLAFSDSEVADGLLSGRKDAKDYLEAAYYFASISVPLVAAAGLFYAGRQLGEQQRSRLAQVYLQVSGKWDSEEMLTARRSLADLVETVRLELNAQGKSVEHAESVVLERSAERLTERLTSRVPLDPADKLKAQQLDTAFKVIGGYFEDVGVLVRKDYIHLDDVNDILGTAVEYNWSLMGELALFHRSLYPDDAVYREFEGLALRLKQMRSRRSRN